jgi:pimeloyl-ACP methyl ester carboxylesterase
MRPLPAPDRLYYRSRDGWESPLLRFPASPGARGEPLLLAHGLGLGPSGFGISQEASLVSAAHAAGYTVYLLAHRGDDGALPPRPDATFDFDDIVTYDIPAALSRICEASGDDRVLWLGHAMGGQLLYAHLALHGADRIAAGVVLCASVRFEAPRSQARLLAAASHLLPSSWPLPTRALHQALAPLTGEQLWQPLGVDLDGPAARGLMFHSTADIHAGLLRQFSTWLSSGSLCDRHDRLDYVAGMANTTAPLLVVSAEGDPVCPPRSARPAFDALSPERSSWLQLDERWGHLDPLVGKRAPTALHPELFRWMERWRHRCIHDRAVSCTAT